MTLPNEETLLIDVESTTPHSLAENNVGLKNIMGVNVYLNYSLGQDTFQISDVKIPRSKIKDAILLEDVATIKSCIFEV